MNKRKNTAGYVFFIYIGVMLYFGEDRKLDAFVLASVLSLIFIVWNLSFSIDEDAEKINNELYQLKQAVKELTTEVSRLKRLEDAFFAHTHDK